jgi:ubiquinone/menaquinone biosynthesis C-methylase UbiE
VQQVRFFWIWAIAASSLFRRVVAVDISSKRLQAAREISQLVGVTNIDFVRADLTAIPLTEDASDWTHIYNVLPFVSQWEETIEETYRTMKLEAICLFWWADIGVLLYNSLESLLFKRFHRIRQVVKTLFQRMSKDAKLYLDGNVPAFLTVNEVVTAVEKSGLFITWKSWSDPWPPDLKPLFPSRYYGLPFARQILAKKLCHAE